MAKNYWRGDSQAIAQRDRFTVGGVVQIGDVLHLKVNFKEVTYEVQTGDDEAIIAAALAAAWQAAIFPEAAESLVEYADGDDFLDLVASTPGMPFTVTTDVTGTSPTTTLTLTNVTPSSGPSHADDPLNWSLGLPDNTQDVVFETGAPMLYGLGTIAALTWEWRASYTAEVGLPSWNKAGYREYRTERPTIDTATGYIGRGDGNGSPRLLFNVIAGSTWYVFKTGTREADIPAVDIGATGNPTRLEIAGGDVGALVADESTARTFGTIRLTGDDSQLTTGRTSTVTTLDMDRGTASIMGTVTTATVGRGLYTQQEGTLTNLVAYGGLIRLNHTGTIASVIAAGRGDVEAPVVDCEANNLARTFTTSSFTGGATLLDENRTVTLAGSSADHVADSSFFTGSRLPPRLNWFHT